MSAKYNPYDSSTWHLRGDEEIQKTRMYRELQRSGQYQGLNYSDFMATPMNEIYARYEMPMVRKEYLVYDRREEKRKKKKGKKNLNEAKSTNSRYLKSVLSFNALVKKQNKNSSNKHNNFCKNKKLNKVKRSLKSSKSSEKTKEYSSKRAVLAKQYSVKRNVLAQKYSLRRATLSEKYANNRNRLKNRVKR